MQNMSNEYIPPAPGTRAAKYLPEENVPLSQHSMAASVIAELDSMVEPKTKNLNYAIFILKEVLKAETTTAARTALYLDLSVDLVCMNEIMDEKKFFFILRNIMLMVGIQVYIARGAPVIKNTLEGLFPSGTTHHAHALKRYQEHAGKIPTPTIQNTPAPNEKMDPSSPPAQSATRSNAENVVNNSVDQPQIGEVTHSPTTSITDTKRDKSSARQDRENDRRDEEPYHDNTGNKSRVALMVKDKCFTGAPDSGIDFYTMSMTLKAACNQQRIPPEEATDVLWHCLDGDAKRFYFDNIQGRSIALPDALKLIQGQFDTLHHQSQAQSFLNSITMQGVRKEKSCNDIEALRLVHERITLTLPKCGPLCQSDGYKILTLERIVKYEAWAANVITTRSANPSLTYSSFYTMLCTAANLHVEKQNQVADTTPSTSTKQDIMSAIPLHYGSTYGMTSKRQSIRRSQNRRDPNRNNGYNPRGRRRTPEQLAALKSRTRCDYCNQLGHWRLECKNREKTMEDVIRGRLEEKSSSDPVVAFAEVLRDITQDEDDYHEHQTFFNEQTDPEEIPVEENSHIALLNNVLYEDIDAQANASEIFTQLALKENAEPDFHVGRA